MSYKILKGRRMPDAKKRGKSGHGFCRSKPKYPFIDMEVGDSFVAGPWTREAHGCLVTAARAMMDRKGLDRTFMARDNKGLLQIWRIK
jgi:hypothetical protein